MRIVFMGTPEFAVPSLAALIDAPEYEVVGVFCQPDRPQGRGNKVVACPTKRLALAHGVPVFQFEKLRAPEGVAALAGLQPDRVVTAAFGQILSQKLLDIPLYGTVNVHASLLPAYRGPAPINWCIMEGEHTTGITTMLTDAGVDTGDMLLQEQVEIMPGESAGALSQRLAPVGAALLLRTLRALEEGTCPRTPQDHGAATHHPMMHKGLGRIDWSRPAVHIANLVRGVDPWPGAYTFLDTTVYKVWQAEAVPVKATSASTGTILLADPKEGLLVAAGEGALRILVLQAPGAKRMAVGDYLRGHPLAVGARFGEDASI